MNLAKVIGTVVSTRKDPGIEGFKLLVLRNACPETLELGGHVIAADAVGAGIDEYVLYATGSSARQTEVTKNRPCDAVVMAIVDQWSIDGDPVYHKSRTDYGYDD
jgi:microcompartment protein CcmK/EutM